MNILVCADGSEHSKKVAESASVIAAGCNVSEVTIIHVEEGIYDNPFFTWDRDGNLREEELKRFIKSQEERRAKSSKILEESLKFFKDKDIKANTILEQGNPAKVILELASLKGFNMIVMGSRGYGGMKKLFLGSVSNAVVQEARNCNVVIVK